MALKVHIETLKPGEPHRCGYSTADDFWYDEEGVLQIRVSDLNNKDSEVVIAIHALVEARGCEKSEVTDQEICAHDKQFEEQREQGLHSDEAEPGDDENSPYREEHQGAIHAERAACHALNLPWDVHQNNVTRYVL